MNQIIKEAKSLLIEDYPEVVAILDRLQLTNSVIDEQYGTYCISHRPHVAPKCFAIKIYSGLPDKIIADFEQIHEVVVPPVYKKFLQVCNGLDVYELRLFGISPTMAKRPPLLDRSPNSPGGLSTANVDREGLYAGVDRSLFHFGYNLWSETENVGFFLKENEEVVGYLSSGSLIGSWNSFNTFLEHELSRAEKAYPEHEEYMSNLLKKYR